MPSRACSARSSSPSLIAAQMKSAMTITNGTSAARVTITMPAVPMTSILPRAGIRNRPNERSELPLAPKLGARIDVVVQMEDVLGVVPALDVDEPVVVRAVRIPDGVTDVVGIEVVHVSKLGAMRLDRGVRLARP